MLLVVSSKCKENASRHFRLNCMKLMSSHVRDRNKRVYYGRNIA